MPERFVFPSHGTPKRYLTAGDPYHCLCHQTTRLVREQLNLPEESCITTFQSRVGREEWLTPCPAQGLQAMPERGSKRMAVPSAAVRGECPGTRAALALV